MVLSICSGLAAAVRVGASISGLAKRRGLMTPNWVAARLRKDCCEFTMDHV